MRQNGSTMKHGTSISILLALACGAVGACEKKTDRPATTTTTKADNAARSTTSPATPAADNTGRNNADRNTDAKTPMDQSNSKADIDITTAIRRAVMDDSALSTNAKNCKIITDKGVVTLRGPVASQAEKDSIDAKAKAAAGVVSVVNQLEVTTN